MKVGGSGSSSAAYSTVISDATKATKDHCLGLGGGHHLPFGCGSKFNTWGYAGVGLVL